MTEGKPIKPTIRAGLKGNPGEVEFSSFEEVEAWATAEVSAWSRNIEWRVNQEIVELIEQQRTPAKELLELAQAALSEDADTKSIRSKIETCLKAYSKGECLHRESAIGETILSYITKKKADAPTVVGGLAAALGYDDVIRSLETDLATFQKFITGFSAIKSLAMPTKSRVVALARKFQNEADALSGQTEALNVATKAAREKSDQILEDQDQQFATQMAEYDEKLKKLIEDYNTGMKLRAPRDYWETKYDSHKGKGLGSLALFLIVAGGAVVGAIALGPDWLTKISSSGKELPWGATVAVTALPVVSALWIMRHLSRLFVSHFELKEDAAMRQTMVETFMAMSHQREAQTSENEMLLVLNALFRPAETKPDDSGPPAGLLEIMRGKDR